MWVSSTHLEDYTSILMQLDPKKHTPHYVITFPFHVHEVVLLCKGDKHWFLIGN